MRCYEKTEGKRLYHDEQSKYCLSDRKRINESQERDGNYAYALRDVANEIYYGEN